MDIYYTHNKELKKATLNVSEDNPLDFVFLGPIPQNNILGSAILVGRYDTNLGQVKYQLEGIPSSGEMVSLNGRDLIGFCIENIPNIDPNSLGIYPNWQTIKIVPNPEERDPLELPDAYEYLGDTSITACSYIEGDQVVVDEGSVEFQDFDYAVIRYIWDSLAGRDLDTRTYLSNPPRNNEVVGWGRLPNDLTYLFWNSDNTGSGVEGILVDITALKRDFPVHKLFEVDLGAFWYGEKASGNVTLEVETYRGGSMQASGYNWVNNGGTLVQSSKLKTRVDFQTKDPSTIGNRLGILRYNTETKLGMLEGLEVLPPIPTNQTIPSEYYEFNISRSLEDTETDSLKIVFRPSVLANQLRQWRLLDLETDTFVVENSKGYAIVSSDYIKVTEESYFATLEILIPLGSEKNYRLITDSAHFEVSQNKNASYNEARSSFNLISFSETSEVVTFKLPETTLKVPENLSRGITRFNNMFENCRFFDDPNIIKWETSYVTTAENMFLGASTFNQDISLWDVSEIWHFTGMFENSINFNQDLSAWVVSHISEEPERFSYNTPNWTLPKPEWGVYPVVKPTFVPFEFRTNSEQERTLTLNFNSLRGYEWYIYKDGILTYRGYEDNCEVTVLPGESVYEVFVSAFNLVLSSTSYEPNNSDSISIISFCDQTSYQRFDLPNCNFTVPETLPSHLTEITSMFSDCNYFNSDISGWDVSRIINMNSIFVNCTNFNQDLSKWNTSKALYMESVFESSGFNGDISGWDTSRVYGMSSMFKNNTVFNQDISSWNVGEVNSMESMFSGATAFNQDLSSWNVKKQTEEPNNFDLGTENTWILPKPIWGTKGVRFTEPLTWTTTNNVRSDRELTTSVTIYEIPDKAVWKLYRNSVLVANSDNFTDSSVIKNYYGSYTINLSLYANGSPTNSYELYTEDLERVELTHPGEDFGNHGVVTINSFCTETNIISFGFKSCDLIVPDNIPRYLRSLEAMFASQTNFNKDLSNWDVSLITNMNYLFQQCKIFNQDLSNWDVSNIITKPFEFDLYADVWEENNKPLWGTEGKAPEYLRIDVTGQSGIYLTLSKNGSPFNTYNLTDPDFDLELFKNTLSTGRTPNSAAFFAYPSIMNYTTNPDPSLGSGFSGLNRLGNVVSPLHPDTGFEIVDGFYANNEAHMPPYNIKKEFNKISFKETPDIPPEYDIFYSIPEAAQGKVISITSNAVIMIE